MADKQKSSEFASTRLTTDVYRKVNQLANDEQRSLSRMLRILVEEALLARNGRRSK